MLKRNKITSLKKATPTWDLDLTERVNGKIIFNLLN